jgi:hypothetical protein
MELAREGLQVRGTLPALQHTNGRGCR